MFDVVIADYLVGAMEGFTPFQQEKLFSQLKKYVGKRMYIVGQEPYQLPNDYHGKLNYSEHVKHANGEKLAQEMVSSILIVGCISEPKFTNPDIMKLRDAVLLLTGERFYREFPVEWIIHALETAGYKVEDVRLFPIVWGSSALLKQLQLCTDKMEQIRGQPIMISPTASQSLLDELTYQVKSLSWLVKQSRVIQSAGVCYGMDYVVTASPIKVS